MKTDKSEKGNSLRDRSAGGEKRREEKRQVLLYGANSTMA